jgi:hypothetical protein
MSFAAVALRHFDRERAAWPSAGSFTGTLVCGSGAMFL